MDAYVTNGTGQTAVRRMYRRLVPLSRMLHNGVEVGVQKRRAGSTLNCSGPGTIVPSLVAAAGARAPVQRALLASHEIVGRRASQAILVAAPSAGELI